MRRARLGAAIGAMLTASVLVISLADCHEPTQIEIDVRTDSCAAVKNLGIAVGTRDTIEAEPLSSFSQTNPGCQDPGDRIGTLVIYPSGAKDAEVAVRIVVGINRSASDCKEGDYQGCIVTRKYERFVPGEARKVVILMQGKCTGKDCGPNAECREGGCVTPLADGGAVDAGPPLEGGPNDATITDAPSDAPADVIVDAGWDACGACLGTCTGGTQCAIDCSKVNCNAGTLCGPQLDCTISCPQTGNCANTKCATDASCRFDCTTNNNVCGSIACNADRCYVNCTGAGTCGGNISLSGGDGGIECSGGGACTNGSDYCDASHCVMDCKENTGGANCATNRLCYANDAAGGCVGPWQ